MYRKVRIFILLFILFLVAAGSWLTHTRLTDWNDPVWVVVYPIAGDNSKRTLAYIRALKADDLQAIETFVALQARRHRVFAPNPVKLVVGPVVNELPPTQPSNGSVISIMYWSLRLRYWAWQNEHDDLLGQVSLFVIFHDSARTLSVPHSLGLKEGHIGVVHAFADHRMTQSNNVVIAHEFLHTLGASDKYDLSNNLPLYPEGYADAQREPRFPQDSAEIMAGRIPISAAHAVTPRSLREAVVGNLTAEEIGW
jgi:hypothetical protein